MSADRDRETREAEAREEIAGYVKCTPAYVPVGEFEYRMADGILALPALRAVREHDALRRDLAALAEEHRRWAVINRDLADRMDSPDADYHIGMAQAQESSCKHLLGLLDDGEGGR